MATLVSSTSLQPARRFAVGGKLRHLLLHIILLAGGLFWIYPFLWMLSSSFKSQSGFYNEGLSLMPKEFLWSNYTGVWTEGSFGQYFFNSIFVTVGTVVFTLLFASMAGYTLARHKFAGRPIVIGSIIVTLFLPTGYTIIPIYDLIQRMGLLDFPLIALILIQVGGSMVFSTFLFMGYFHTIDRELEEAAIIDGASFHQLFWQVMFPLATPMLATVGLFTLIGSWNAFFVPLVFTIADANSRTLPVGTYSFVGLYSANWPYVCAAAVITLAPIILVFVFLQRYFISAIAGAIKG